jgi:hypothetical protein
MGNQCGATPSDPYHVNLCMLSYSGGLQTTVGNRSVMEVSQDALEAG